MTVEQTVEVRLQEVERKLAELEAAVEAKVREEVAKVKAEFGGSQPNPGTPTATPTAP